MLSEALLQVIYNICIKTYTKGRNYEKEDL